MVHSPYFRLVSQNQHPQATVTPPRPITPPQGHLTVSLVPETMAHQGRRRQVDPETDVHPNEKAERLHKTKIQ